MCCTVRPTAFSSVQLASNSPSPRCVCPTCKSVGYRPTSLGYRLNSKSVPVSNEATCVLPLNKHVLPPARACGGAFHPKSTFFCPPINVTQCLQTTSTPFSSGVVPQAVCLCTSASTPSFEFELPGILPSSRQHHCPNHWPRNGRQRAL